jgi:hypothetical protein
VRAAVRSRVALHLEEQPEPEVQRRLQIDPDLLQYLLQCPLNSETITEATNAVTAFVAAGIRADGQFESAIRIIKT